VIVAPGRWVMPRWLVQPLFGWRRIQRAPRLQASVLLLHAAYRTDALTTA
jgi:hypothetical protein